MTSRSKVPYFFFPRNSLPPLTHSIFENFVFFFFPLSGKKKIQTVFFFSQEKFAATHSSEERIIYRKKVKNTYVLQFFHILVVFFFPTFFQLFLFFFFPRKSLKSTHSLDFLGRKKKKTAAEKKKTQFSLTQSIFAQKVQILNYSGEIKKYGTFDIRSNFYT